MGPKDADRIPWSYWKEQSDLGLHCFAGSVYPPELQLNKANTADTEAPFLDLHLSIPNGFVSSKIYDKGYDLDFDIVNFPFLDGDVPRSTSYRFIFLNFFGLLECLVMWLISMPVIKV